MTSSYKTWVGEVPYAIIVDSSKVPDLLYYETGFEQLHPLPEIHQWMEDRNYEYRNNWKVVRVDPDKGRLSDWAFCFDSAEMRDMFALRWL